MMWDTEDRHDMGGESLHLRLLRDRLRGIVMCFTPIRVIGALLVLALGAVAFMSVDLVLLEAKLSRLAGDGQSLPFPFPRIRLT